MDWTAGIFAVLGGLIILRLGSVIERLEAIRAALVELRIRRDEIERAADARRREGG